MMTADLKTTGMCVALFVAAVSGCQPMRQNGADDTVVTQAARDTVRGTISVVGSEPLTSLVLSPVTGAAPMALVGAHQVTLRGLSGLEVMVAGRRTANMSAAIPRPGGGAEFEVDSFVVRAVDGVAATDGIVASEGGRFYLVTANGSRLRADFLPVALRQKIGARVFVAGALDQTPASYGVIVARP